MKGVIDPAVIVRDYDGTLDGLKAAITSVTADPELRALGLNHTIPDILHALEALYYDCFLQSVGCIVIQRVGIHVVRLNNTNPTPSVAADNRRCAFVEVTDVRNRAMTALRDKRAEAADWSMAHVASMATNSVVPLFAMIAGLVVGVVTRGRRGPLHRMVAWRCGRVVVSDGRSMGPALWVSQKLWLTRRATRPRKALEARRCQLVRVP